jgi:hypothetical protein
MLSFYFVLSSGGFSASTSSEKFDWNKNNAIASNPR